MEEPETLARQAQGQTNRDDGIVFHPAPGEYACLAK
jgi:hypothetical protein